MFNPNTATLRTKAKSILPYHKGHWLKFPPDIGVFCSWGCHAPIAWAELSAVWAGSLGSGTPVCFPHGWTEHLCFWLGGTGEVKHDLGCFFSHTTLRTRQLRSRYSHTCRLAVFFCFPLWLQPKTVGFGPYAEQLSEMDAAD